MIKMQRKIREKKNRISKLDFHSETSQCNLEMKSIPLLFQTEKLLRMKSIMKINKQILTHNLLNLLCCFIPLQLTYYLSHLLNSAYGFLLQIPAFITTDSFHFQSISLLCSKELPYIHHFIQSRSYEV